MIKKSLSGGIFDTRLQTKPQEAAPPPPPPEKTGGRTIWRNIIWQLILFVYSGIGGVAFSAIEGNFC